jgi:hypothetical protein
MIEWKPATEFKQNGFGGVISKITWGRCKVCDRCRKPEKLEWNRDDGKIYFRCVDVKECARYAAKKGKSKK